MQEARIAHSDDIIFTYFVTSGHMTSFARKACYITSDTHIRKMDLITAEILQFKKCSIGIFFQVYVLTLLLHTLRCRDSLEDVQVPASHNISHLTITIHLRTIFVAGTFK